MYSIYHTAYRISDEMKRQKENEKPFWWEHLHPEVKDKSMEEIDKMLVSASVPTELIKQMPRNEKYLAVSEGLYVIDAQNNEQLQEENEKTDFLNEPPETPENIPDSNAENMNIPSAIPGTDAIPDDNSSHVSINKRPESTPAAGEHQNGSSFNPMDKNAPAVNNGAVPGNANSGALEPNKTAGNKSDIRKYARNIVRDAVNKINADADKIPDSASSAPNDELLSAVIDELQKLR